MQQPESLLRIYDVVGCHERGKKGLISISRSAWWAGPLVPPDAPAPVPSATAKRSHVYPSMPPLQVRTSILIDCALSGE
jgi:hypothetical protein